MALNIKNSETERDEEQRLRRIADIVAEIKKLPVLDDRPADEIIGYDEHGLFK